jgi:sortase A
MKKSATFKFAIPQFIVKVFFVFVFLAGAAVTAYPFYRDSLNDALGQKVVQNYQSKENQAFREKRAKELKAKQKASSKLKKELEDPFSEESLENARHKATTPTTDFLVKHTIAIVYIPKINQQLPIFDTINETFMDRGATWIDNTSYPDGGKDSHTVISAHRGLPTAKLFTDLPKLANGDLFIIESAGKYLAYQVFRTKVVTPEEVEVLDAEPGKDIATLLPCTPYMVNTHRLLVTGKRVPFTPTMTKDMNGIKRAQFWKKWGVIGGITLAVVAAMTMFYFSWLRLRHARRNYDLSFKLENAPHDDFVFQLFNHNGKKPMIREGAPFISTVHPETGLVTFENVPVITYKVKQIKGHESITIDETKFYIRKIKATSFHTKIKRAWKKHRALKDGILTIKIPE